MRRYDLLGTHNLPHDVRHGVQVLLQSAAPQHEGILPLDSRQSRVALRSVGLLCTLVGVRLRLDRIDSDRRHSAALHPRRDHRHSADVLGLHMVPHMAALPATQGERLGDPTLVRGRGGATH